MATVDEPTTKLGPGEHRFVIRNVGWEGYEGLLKIFERGGPLITYDRGDVELMSPLIYHERCKRLAGRLIEIVIEELDIPCVAAGSTTFRAQAVDRGLEADECYFFGDAGRIAGIETFDLAVDPPPDLAIEIEITNPLLNKVSVYAGLGIPELWRCDGEGLKILLLGPDRTYVESETSGIFPFLPMDDVLRFVKDHGTNDTRWARTVRAWVRDVVAPRYHG